MDRPVSGEDPRSKIEQQIVNDMALHIGDQIDAIMQRSCNSLAGMVGVGSLMELYLQVATTMQYADIGFIAANLADEAQARSTVDALVNDMPRIIDSGRERAFNVGRETRAAALANHRG
jgi:hypothetical protein